MPGIASLTADQKEYLIDGVHKYTLFSDMKAILILEGVDTDFIDTVEASVSYAGYKRRAFQDLYGFAGSTEGWASVALAQITPAPAGTSPVTFDTAGGEEIIILGSMFIPGSTVTMGGEPVTVLAMTPGTILGITPALAAAADNDIVVKSPTDLEGTLTPGPATAKKDPTFVSITPATGPIAGGSRHILVGTKFCPGVTVTIGGHACVVERLDEQTLVVKPPAHAAGALNILITNVNAEDVTAVGGFTYV